MRLYTYWRSTAAYRVRLALNLKGLAYESVEVDLLADPNGSAREEYRTRNPHNLVPALRVDDRLLSQSTAIIEYLEEQYPEPSLLPGTAYGRALARSMAQLIACDMHPLNNVGVLNFLRAELGVDDAGIDLWYGQWIARGFSALESQIGAHRGRYCLGDEITLPDLYLVPQMYNARRFECDVRPYPILVEISQRLEQLDAFLRAAPERVKPA